MTLNENNLQNISQISNEYNFHNERDENETVNLNLLKNNLHNLWPKYWRLYVINDDNHVEICNLNNNIILIKNNLQNISYTTDKCHINNDDIQQYVGKNRRIISNPKLWLIIILS